jgi:carboxyl-terminal processing protease
VIRLTTARYHTPTGRCIQKPYDEGVDEYYKDFKKRLDEGELVSADSIDFPDSLKYFTPNGRVVYGGGGVMPDVFIPIDSTRFSDYYTDLVRKGIFNDFVMNYLDKNRDELLRKYSDITAFKQGFEIDEETFEAFIAKASESEVVRSEDDEYYYPDENIKVQLKALMARNIYDVGAYFQVISSLDDELRQAIELLEDGSMFSELKLD